MALIHLDAGILIGFLDADDAHHSAARTAIAEAIDRGDRLAMASSALAECLVAPARRGEEAIALVHELRQRLPIEIVPLDVDVATTAARLRAQHRSLRLPDALVIATASVDAADQLVTTDPRWPTAKALHLTVTIRTL
ncbi:MAG: type II toxin-antitoxin system VapC family toxin [Acidimicrobiales bacterium]